MFVNKVDRMIARLEEEVEALKTEGVNRSNEERKEREGRADALAISLKAAKYTVFRIEQAIRDASSDSLMFDRLRLLRRPD